MQLTESTSEPEMPSIPARTWQKIESAFRLWSFQIYYARSYATVTDPTLRFAMALVASTQPIRDRDAVMQWHRSRQPQSKRAGHDDA